MKLDLEMTLKNVNVRREKAGEEDGDVAMDLKFSASVKPAKLKSLFGTPTGYALVLGDLFTDTKELACTDVAEITLARSFENCDLELKSPLATTTLNFEGGKFNQIKLTPEAGGTVLITCRAQIYPTEKQIGQVAEWLTQTIDVSVQGKQAELDLTDADDEVETRAADAEEFDQPAATH